LEISGSVSKGSPDMDPEIEGVADGAFD